MHTETHYVSHRVTTVKLYYLFAINSIIMHFHYVICLDYELFLLDWRCTGDDDKKYKLLESFVSEKCDKRCICQADGKLDCTPVCPLNMFQCGPNEKQKFTQKPLRGTKCSCPVMSCEPKDSKDGKLKNHLF